MPFSNIDDPLKLKRLLDSILMIGADVDLAVLLRHIVEEACSLVGAKYGALGVLNETRTRLEEFVTVGLSYREEESIGSRPTGRGVLGLLITEPQALRLDDLGAHPDSYGFPAHHPPMTSFLGVPVRTRSEVYGNLYLTDKIGAPVFSNEDEEMAKALAHAAGIAIENYRLHDRMRTISVLTERDRIARDLHDLVIQRIFATGMVLEEATRLSSLDDVKARVERSIDLLDATITEVRTTIYELGHSGIPGGLRHTILELCNELSPTIGVRPEVTFHGPIDDVVNQPIADNLVAVTRELLTNIGKHSHARSAFVAITATDQLSLEVSDDGGGVELPLDFSRGSGLTNLHSRAERLRGTFRVERRENGGTCVTWSIPL
ncbi:MAG: GAF domain-containing sensor histidine kinase [Acidimicrobiales bacterium]